MILLVTKSLPTVRRMGPNVGRLFSPRMLSSIAATADWGVPWAADNDAFQGFKPGPYLKMLGSLAGVPGCLFVTAPDVVADWAATKVLWDIYWPVIHDADLPAAVVLQDGCDHIPAEADAVFIGGSTIWKMGDEARLLAAEAKERGLWVHMGRVNTIRRIQYAASIGCDSIDGTNWSRFTDTYLHQLEVLNYPQQRLVGHLQDGENG